MATNLQEVNATLNRIVHSLATSPENLRGRLAVVAPALFGLSKTDFPEVLRDDFDWVMHELKFDWVMHEPRLPEETLQMSVARALARRRGSSLVKIAMRIVYISDHWHAIVNAKEWPK